MKALCITGADNATLADIAAPFFEAGMERSKPLQRESSIDFARWHQQVSDTLVNNKPMGKLWENIATDLILANLESDCWGWYEANSVNALEFWANLEPNIHFLLVCTRPEQELADKMAHTKPDSEAHGWLEQWHQRHQSMLDFYLKYPDRCILVDATDARRHLGGQLALAHEHWQLPLHAASVEDQPRDAHNEPRQDQPGSQLASLIVRELIKSSNKDITGLYAEMQAAQYPLNQDDTSEPASSRLMDWLRADIDSPMLQSLLTDFHALHSAASQSQRLLALQSDQTNTARQLEQDLSSAKSQQQAANQLMQDARQENELLLLQLQQVQEELESTFMAKQSLEKNLTVASQQNEAGNQALQQARQAAASNEQQHLQARTELTQLQQQNEDLEKHLNESIENQSQAAEWQKQQEDARQENELLLLQLHQVQEELESTFMAKQSLEKNLTVASQQNEARNQELQQARQAVASKEQQHLQARTELTQLRQQKDDLEKRLNESTAKQSQAAEWQKQQDDTRQENELLLLQLHQVQEELEHYFLEHQKHQQDITELQQKLELYKRQGTAQYSTAKVTLMDDGQLQWQLTDAQLGGSEWPALTITGQAKLSKTELTIHSDDQAETWVLNTKSTSRALSNAQFAMAQDLPKALKGALEHAPLAARQKKRWHKALDRLQLRLNQQPPRLLYSNVRLKHEQVNPDYEHLWLTLEQLSFNNTHLQSWSFRLSCAGLTPNEFGNQPKLELPEQDTQLLDNWFQESHDQFGNKLEVRFALPNAMDMGVWKRLAASDQRLLKTLIDQLPDILAELEQQGRSLQRPWADWQQVVAEMRRITRTKTVK